MYVDFGSIDFQRVSFNIHRLRFYIFIYTTLMNTKHMCIISNKYYLCSFSEIFNSAAIVIVILG